MSRVGWLVAAVVTGVITGFVVSLLLPRRATAYGSTYEPPSLGLK